MTEQRQVSEIVWRQDLYPRFEPNPATIQQYAESIDMLPPIEINQHNELIDGYHRWTAHRKAGVDTIPVTVTVTASDREFEILAIRRNATHGLQLTSDEKKARARRLYTGKKGEKEELAQLLAVSARTLHDWLSRIDKDMKDERDRRIAQMWLACYTEEEIAAAVGCSLGTVSSMLEEPSELAGLQKMKVLSEYREPEWSPPIYDVWKQQDKSDGTKHPGNTEASFLDRLMYMYTEPFDIVVDPFGGGGSTIDVCKKRLRRYWVSDRLPIVERTDIRQADILDGPPVLHKRWGNVRLLYLDPPYWRQVAGQYSQDPQDLANMPLEDFYNTLAGFVEQCAGKMKAGAHIALIIQPTQWKADDKQVVDHIIDLVIRLQKSPMRYVRRIQCPYESQQCNAQMVEWAKANRDILVLSREIIVWEVL